MNGVLACVTLLAACGRVGFDAHAAGTPDGGGHDEDGDGLTDLIDPCPHLADGAQLDSDGDGVGDACDPEPAVARQSIALFAPMTGPDARLALQGVWTQEADAIRSDLAGQVNTPVAAGDLDVWLGFDIVGVDAAAETRHLVLNVNSDSVVPLDYTEMYETSTAPAYAGVSEFDGTTYAPIASEPLADSVHTGAVTWHGEFRASTGQVAVHVDVDGDRHDVTAPTPAFAGADVVRFGFNSVEVSLRYLVVIVTT